MQLRRGLLLGLLVYVALDLSVPVVGGAFVFEASERIESLQGSRTRTASLWGVAPRLPDVGAIPEPRVRCLDAATALPAEPVAGDRVVVHHRPRAALTPAAPTDDH